MPHYYFQLGNTPALSLAELAQLLPVKPSPIKPDLAQAQLESNFSTQLLQEQAGGVVKILKKIGTVNTKSRETLKEKIVAHLLAEHDSTDKLTFSLFYLDSNFQPQLKLAELKRELNQKISNVRYLKNDSAGLSAAVLLHQEVLELALFEGDGEIILAKTVTVQDIDDWTKRDRKKPYADRQRGMLPPKVARMMVNLAQGQLATIGSTSNKPLLYDPFCGSGTVLMEAALRGFQIQGADLSAEAVEGTQKNLSWLKNEYQLEFSFQVKKRDATQSFDHQTTPFVDAIVTEPFLGKQTPTEKELPNIFKGLYRTYLGTIKNWRQILKDRAVVVMITPIVKGKNKTYQLQKLIDNWADLGYTTISQPIEYSRSAARVKRQINFLRYHKE